MFWQRQQKRERLCLLYQNARITTSEDVENPDYFVRIRKGKFVPQKKIIASGNQLYIADVPTPFTYPLHIFP